MVHVVTVLGVSGGVPTLASVQYPRDTNVFFQVAL
jgi:hypothetical protein